MDFLKIDTKSKPGERNVDEIRPKFLVGKKKDLMIRGGDFYAVWDEARGKWSTSQDDVIRMVDDELEQYRKKKEELAKQEDRPRRYSVAWMWDSDSGSIDRWKKYVTKQQEDNYHPLDEVLIFANSERHREDYSSKQLPYPLEAGAYDCWDEIVGTLYNPEERHKIEWAIGAVVSGDSRDIQKFLVFYGAGGSGKSTILNIIQMLFDGYYCLFDAKALGSANDAFALEPFKDGPLVAIQHDGDLSRIEDNTRLNSLVSHEEMVVNEKHKSLYSKRFCCMLFMGTNKPVKITDSRSGIIRRLIDVHPKEQEKIEYKRYCKLMDGVRFELGAIAQHCLEVYEQDKNCYDSYIPIGMMGATNDTYNFMEENFEWLLESEYITLNEAWNRYNEYCTSAKIPDHIRLRKMQLKEELKAYFKVFKERGRSEDGKTTYNLYSDLRKDKFGIYSADPVENQTAEQASWLKMDCAVSLFDMVMAHQPAQYTTESGTPRFKWMNVDATLKDIDTTQLHYVKVPENLIVIDFDISNSDGVKLREANIEAASKWPKTYAEFSKSGAGVHLHYYYAGDPSKLSRIYEAGIEIKVFTGNSSLRRKLTFCNDIPIATITSGLPLREEKPVVNFDGLKNDKALKTLILRALNKEYAPYATKPSIDLVKKVLDDAYASGIHYDVTPLRPALISFAAQSTHQANKCLELVGQMKFKSDESSASTENDDEHIAFYDVEVFPNLFVVVWKSPGLPPVKMINPTPEAVEDLCKLQLIGFNCRRYDNHILYARMMGWNNGQLYNLSQRIIAGDKDAFFGEAYNISKTDVFDFCAKKQSLKKWEIELGQHHQELGLRWDQPVDKSMWQTVADYCVNDVLATEATYYANKADYVAREILTELANIFAPKTKSTVNDTTNTLTGRIIFGDEKNPQSEFVYTDLRQYFPGYVFDRGKSTYRGVEVGEGGRVYANPGIYHNVKTFDIASMHPHSIIALNLFGDRYTKKFKMLVDLRILIKHKKFDEAKQLFDGALSKYLDDPDMAKALSGALKIAINSVYGLTSANFPNKFKDPRNIDNIVAKRGALFMVDLQHEVEARGGTVVHIKTDSIKIEDPSPEIEEFICDYGKKWGYTFEVESEYDRMCLVNDAVYIAKYKVPQYDKVSGKEQMWTATGTQFQVPYVFKTLFSKEPIEFNDLCETKSVTSALYLDMNEDLPNVSEYEKELDKLNKQYKGLDIPEEVKNRMNELNKLISVGHSYKFIGRVGQFCPIKPGFGGGVLLREKDGKYSAATGTKGYRWLESEDVKLLKKENAIDDRYYRILVDGAVAAISEYGDFEAFIAS